MMMVSKLVKSSFRIKFNIIFTDKFMNYRSHNTPFLQASNQCRQGWLTLTSPPWANKMYLSMSLRTSSSSLMVSNQKVQNKTICWTFWRAKKQILFQTHNFGINKNATPAGTHASVLKKAKGTEVCKRISLKSEHGKNIFNNLTSSSSILTPLYSKQIN